MVIFSDPDTECLVGMPLYKSKHGGIGGRIKVVPEDFMVEEIPLLPSCEKYKTDNFPYNDNFTEIPPVPDFEGYDYVHFTLKKRNYDTLRAIRTISNRLNISASRLSYAGMKDKNAVSSQQISLDLSPSGMQQREKIYGKLLNLSGNAIKDIVVSGFEFRKFPLYLGDLWGNDFTITIRDISKPPEAIRENVSKILYELRGGFPNFYGLQRFGDVRPITHLVGKKMLCGDFFEAVRIYLCDVYEGESDENKSVRQYLSDTMDFPGALKRFPKSMGYELSMLNFLIQHPGDYRGAIEQLPEGLRTMFVHAYQSYIFNRALSEYIRRDIPVEFLPLAADGTMVDEITGEILKKEGIYDNVKIDVGEFAGNYNGLLRRCFEFPRNFEIISIEDDEIFEGKFKLKVKFALRKGCYATVFLREIMKGGKVSEG